ncbi:hypothetical protein DL766_005158 [Monosporascus sp. MC13-8B]|uniref:NUDE domain-containing protein n=1 Tax=Monosporascus cannonballus TaxID=155416 RepID=A0ABY0HMW4_9PEZI|nr:hypothetical protein DL763_005686 [Monosporascus cannonballus]RYO94302.1 hypothetical protein DL762_000626 [Monosporascus cannonballus]RYP29859.1 hypothetical protein DL766_005158 [Monosporascus sp. MC13-8B]
MADLRPPNPPSTGTPAPPAETSTMESHGTTQAETALPMKCCCGRLNCVFLRHNCSVLDSVEKEVHTAARMGQALLARHEAYMADAERDRRELTTRIEQLEMDNKELEARNARAIEDNRNLLDQLEALNSTVNDSEARIKSLEATLLFSQQTIRRLEGETARAEALERQLMLLEQEQADLQNNLSLSRDEARSAVSRWKRAEREINDLQEQLERIEREARQEREHHAEMMSRIEKQREMEKELNTAAGRLKGAAAIKSIDYGKNGGNVVSHFVRDLLQDNANLQHGIAELREMLLNSHDEIQALRDQLVYHQPLGEGGESSTPTLKAELEPLSSPKAPSPRVSQEFHIHHHYHVSKSEGKKPRRKRQSLPNGVTESPPGSRPSTPPAQRHLVAHSRGGSRWSLLSDRPSNFSSSALGSPQSNPRSSSIFDRIAESLPCSPITSVDPTSPTWQAAHRKQPSNMSSRSFQGSTHFLLAAAMPSQTHPIIEETDDTDHAPELTTTATTDESAADDEASSRDLENANDDVSLRLTDTDDDNRTRPPRLRRQISQESIISLTGGLDIHTLKSRPSQLTLRPISSTSSSVASSTVTARPMISRGAGKRSSALLRDSFSAYGSPSTSGTTTGTSTPLGASLKLGKWVGWRPWGGGGGSGRTDSPGLGATVDSAGDSNRRPGRPPGINQRGAIPGFAEYVAAAQKKLPPPKIAPEVVDQVALTEGLSE